MCVCVCVCVKITRNVSVLFLQLFLLLMLTLLLFNMWNSQCCFHFTALRICLFISLSLSLSLSLFFSLFPPTLFPHQTLLPHILSPPFALFLSTILTPTRALHCTYLPVPPMTLNPHRGFLTSLFPW